ncbi:hypothetical protein J31TS4_37620 [Paenibacillus sp. J31TS4]|uniref:DUF3298 and DUF4163 domain-containing protein n=1 Tax=Paenibacillus sp. J31TS4 TaxID=2807195 RepID=UPI001B2ADFAF|nr:DUF3298 and DUF4163 domain-containing protein [Paenibacillus sp. J31TS4]GIP40482.1 hypothetical protein J31TS4_37620 [Paenibacillus sp. J31TS4]
MTVYQRPALVQVHPYHAGVIRIDTPVVSGLAHAPAQAAINRTLRLETNRLIDKQRQTQSGTLQVMDGHFEVKTNERGLLSFLLSNSAYSAPMAHGFTAAKSLTFDNATGRVYTLAELFKPGADYVGAISALIAAQIKRRDLPLLNGFTAIRPDQSFYLADKALVVYFELYEITPYYVGFPMFPISVYDLQSLYADPGPLSTLAVDIA